MSWPHFSAWYLVLQGLGLWLLSLTLTLSNIPSIQASIVATHYHSRLTTTNSLPVSSSNRAPELHLEQTFVSKRYHSTFRLLLGQSALLSPTKYPACVQQCILYRALIYHTHNSTKGNIKASNQPYKGRICAFNTMMSNHTSSRALVTGHQLHPMGNKKKDEHLIHSTNSTWFSHTMLCKPGMCKLYLHQSINLRNNLKKRIARPIPRGTLRPPTCPRAHPNTGCLSKLP